MFVRDHAPNAIVLPAKARGKLADGGLKALDAVAGEGRRKELCQERSLG
jgi:hypothetical protein